MGTTTFIQEKEMEDRLIEQLTTGQSQWTYRPDIRTEEDLWLNLRQKLEQSGPNKVILNGVPLTDQEFDQVKMQLQFATFYDAAQWLVGENGIAKVRVQREDAALGTISLQVINNKEINGGTSSYEVINQFQAKRQKGMDRDRRFDVTLLINGLPMIHIELKNRNHPFMDGFRQIKKYIAEGKFRGLFSCVQIFVVSNGSDTRYIAAAMDTKLKEQFLTKWVDKENTPVINYIDFAAQVLRVPEAHHLIADYTVLDNERKSIIVLRPYQIHAIKAIRQASARQQSGYVWHTTGSGKTLTSYKVARNLSKDLKSFDKSIFIVDRVDLDQQTTSSFQAYAANDTVEIDETDNVKHLIQRLKSKDTSVIVTTIQKLNYVISRYIDKGADTAKRHDKEAPKEEEKREREGQKLRQLKIAFVVDECHRAVSPEKKRELESFFVRSLWYGFTGTPIFKENARTAKGDLARTTEQLYGPCLHKYTVKEAIHDKAVLGFQVEYKHTLSEETLDDLVEGSGVSPDKAADMTPVEKEKYIRPAIYTAEKHMLTVIDYIINKARAKLGFHNGVGRTYDAILTTSSIKQAQLYYKLFQKVKEGRTDIQISKRVQEVLPDFPKVAITYSVGNNEESALANQKDMEASLVDYNAMFGTHYTMEELPAYNREINDRLARKKERYQSRSEQLDLIIVVDRLLTGFDAPCLSTLFIDRPPMKEYSLIQAFSRTNRLYDKGKQFGQIVIFQLPHMFKEQVQEALLLYSNGGESDVLAPTWEESKSRLQTAIGDFRTSTDRVDLTAIEAEQTPALRQFAKAFQRLDSALSAVQVYSEYEERMLGTTFAINREELEDYHGVYENVIDELRRRRSDDEDDSIDSIDIQYELQSVHTDEINYQYILSLIQTYMPTSQAPALFMDIPKKKEEEIQDLLATFGKNHPQIANLIMEIWEDVKVNPQAFVDKSVSEELDARIKAIEAAKIKQFADKYFVKEDTVAYAVSGYRPGRDKQFGETELKDEVNRSYPAYKADAESKGETPIKKLKYWITVRKEFINFMDSEIEPLRTK